MSGNPFLVIGPFLTLLPILFQYAAFDYMFGIFKHLNDAHVSSYMLLNIYGINGVSAGPMPLSFGICLDTLTLAKEYRGSNPKQ